MLLPRKMLTLPLLWYLSSLWEAQLSEAVGWPWLGKCAKQLLLQTSPGLLWVSAWTWLQGASEAGAAFLPAWVGVLHAQDQPAWGCAQPHGKGSTVEVLSPNPSCHSCTRDMQNHERERGKVQVQTPRRTAQCQKRGDVKHKPEEWSSFSDLNWMLTHSVLRGLR